MYIKQIAGNQSGVLVTFMLTKPPNIKVVTPTKIKHVSPTTSHVMYAMP